MIEYVCKIILRSLSEKSGCLTVGPIANLKGHYFQPSLSVSVCVSLTGTSTLQRWLILTKLGHKDPIVIYFGRDHNCPDWPQRDRATPFWKFEKILKNNRIWISKFWSIIFLRLCLLCIVKKFRVDSNKTDGGDRFWSLPLWRFWQWHCCSSTTLDMIFWLNQRHGGVQWSKVGGVRNWGHNRVVETNQLVFFTDCTKCFSISCCDMLAVWLIFSYISVLASFLSCQPLTIYSSMSQSRYWYHLRWQNIFWVSVAHTLCYFCELT